MRANHLSTRSFDFGTLNLSCSAITETLRITAVTATNPRVRRVGERCRRMFQPAMSWLAEAGNAPLLATLPSASTEQPRREEEIEPFGTELVKLGPAYGDRGSVATVPIAADHKSVKARPCRFSSGMRERKIAAASVTERNRQIIVQELKLSTEL